MAKILTEEHKKKISESLKGHIMTEGTKEKIRQKAIGNMKTKVLVGAPCSKRHGHLVGKWVDNVRKFKPECDIMLVDNTLDDGKFYKKLCRLRGVKVLRHIWKPAKKMLDLAKHKQGHRHHLQMLADCRQKIRDYFLKGSYTHLFNLDVDVFPKPDYLQKLIDYNKDQVGPVIHVFAKPRRHKPATFHSPKILIRGNKPELDYYTFKEIEGYKQTVKLWLHGKTTNGFKPDDLNNPFLEQVYATSFGCLLIKRKVIETVPFRTHPTYIYGEDLWFYKEAYDKGFKAWLDTTYRVPHLNCKWFPVNKLDFEQRLCIKWIPIGGKICQG